MSRPLERRRLLAALAAGGLACAVRPRTAKAQATPPSATSHDPFGPVVPPLQLPKTRLLTHRGEKVALHSLLEGRITALQLMFTGCSATCPIQGAVFAAAQQRLGSSLDAAQWLSISIDPMADDPKALTQWLQGHGARPGWAAAAPEYADLDPLLDALRGRANGPDRHTGAAFILDRRGMLRFRTVDLPAPDHLADIVRKVATLA